MKKLPAAVYLAASVAALGQVSIRPITQTIDVNLVGQEYYDTQVQWFSGDSLRWDVYARDGRTPINFTGTAFPVLFIAAEGSAESVYIAQTGTVVSATNGHVRVTVAPEAARLAPGNYRSWVTVYRVTSGATQEVATVSYCRSVVTASPFGADWDYVEPGDPPWQFTFNPAVPAWVAADQGDVLLTGFDATGFGSGGPDTTDALLEGSTNLYHTAARAVAAIGADPTYTQTVAQAGAAYGWGDHAAAGYAGKGYDSGPLYSDFVYWSLTEIPISVADTTTVTTNRDAIVTAQLFDGTTYDYGILLDEYRTVTNTLALTGSDDAVATLDGLRLTRVANGSMTLTGTLGAYVRTQVIDFTTEYSTTVYRATGAATGSVREAVLGVMTGAVAGITITNVLTDTQMFLHTGKALNETSWAYDLDTTCRAVYDSHWSGNWGAVTLISSNVAVMADHHSSPPGVGATVQFVARDNTITTQTISAVAGMTSAGWDIRVLLLTPGVDVAAYTPAQILPADYEDYISFPPYSYYLGGETVRDAMQIPALFTDRYRRAYVCLLYDSTPSGFRYMPPIGSIWEGFYSTPVVGDSSNPVLIYPTASQPILIATHFGPTIGPCYESAYSGLAAAISSLGGAAPTRYSFASFTPYPED